MKTIIIGITAAIGLLGGAASMVGTHENEEHSSIEYIEAIDDGPSVHFINFTEPLEIKGRVMK
jgi:hypothetical protein